MRTLILAVVLGLSSTAALDSRAIAAPSASPGDSAVPVACDQTAKQKCVESQRACTLKCNQVAGAAQQKSCMGGCTSDYNTCAKKAGC